jgi:hypothetical protein
MLEGVEFHPSRYTPEIARILEQEGGGQRQMPLVRTGESFSEAREAVKHLAMPEAARAGLYLYLSCWDEAHSAADGVENPDGYFWHAIVHRQEPDPGNAAYWFRRVGPHPIFPKLAMEAADRSYPTGGAWDPFAFIQFCESTRKHPGSNEERLAREVQLLEWQLLFDHCARGSDC